MLKLRLVAGVLTLAIGILACGSSSVGQETPSMDAAVVELLLGQEGALYAHGRPDYAGLIALGEPAVPVILRHAGDRPQAAEAVYTTLFYYLFQRTAIPGAARDWLVAEFGRGKTDSMLVSAIGLLGGDDRLPRLIELASKPEERDACVAVQAIASLGTAKAQAALQQLQGSAASPAAKAQCATLLEALYAPFQTEARILEAVENGDMQALKYAVPGGWLFPDERLLRRVVQAQRRDLAPGLRALADRLVAKDQTLRQRPSDKYLRVLSALQLLGASVTKEETGLLINAHIIDAPAK